MVGASSLPDLGTLANDELLSTPSQTGTGSDFFIARTVAKLPAPWSLEFLPSGDLLVSERPPAGSSVLNPTAEGHIRLVTQSGQVSVPLSGVPDNVGVLDIALSPDFGENHVVYFSFLERDPDAPRTGRAAEIDGIDPAGVAVARAVLDLSDPAGPTLSETSVIWRQLPKVVSNPGSGEPGGRLAFSPDGEYLFIASGDRQEFAPNQSLHSTLGKVVRLYADGSIPLDNPFADISGALPEIWTLGHRNPYGLVFDGNGVLWENEMGPKGGDELNVIRPGYNFGWPNVSYGDFYDDTPITKPVPGDGFAGSELYWTPVIAPSGMIYYTGDAFPEWKGDLIIPGLQSKGLSIVDLDGASATETLRIALGARARDIAQAPDGTLWLLNDQPDGSLIQLSPISGPPAGGDAQPPAAGGGGADTDLPLSPLNAGSEAFAALANGNFVGAWVEERGGASALRAQLYAQDGRKLGFTVTIDLGAMGDHAAPSLVATASGGFAVAYGSRVDGVFNTYLQVFGADGIAVRDRVTLNTGTASFHSPPDMAVLADGRIVATWLGTNASGYTDVRAQILSATGEKMGVEFVVSDHAASSKIGESVTALKDGSFAVAWTDYGAESDAYGNHNTAVRAQIFDAAGQKLGAPFTVNSLPDGNQDQVSLAAASDGGFMAVWRDDGYSVTGGTEAHGSWAQLFGASGVKAGIPVHLGQSGEYGFAPSVSALSGIGYVVTRQAGASSASAGRTVLGQVLGLDGQPLAPAFTLAADAGRGVPSVAAAADGQVIFGWASSAGAVGGDLTTAFHVIKASAGQGAIDGTGGQDLIFGGSADQMIVGGAGADILSGGGGRDTFLGTVADLTGDMITDFAPGDTIRFTGIEREALNLSLSGKKLNFTGGSLTLANLPAGYHLAASAVADGVDVSVVRGEVHNDFNGDGRSDILWRNDSGLLSNWLADVKGGFSQNDAAALKQVDTAWSVVGTGDFNGDARADLLLRDADGRLTSQLAGPGGGFVSNDDVALVSVSTAWHVVGTGDFNGDGRSDILWRSDGGALSDWLGRADGGFTPNDPNALVSVATSWHVAGTGDFNGDGRTDILWRSDDGSLSDWLGTASGGFTGNDGHAMTQVPTQWKVVGTGDFNGDGFDDLLWRHDDGRLSNWLGKADGGFAQNDAHAMSQVSPAWKVADVGDYNGDGRDDILWRHDGGQLSNWLATQNGGFVQNDVNAMAFAPTDWHVQAAAHVFA